MVDYAKLIDEEKARTDSALSIAEAQRKRDMDLGVLFEHVEAALGKEAAKANEELKKHDAPVFGEPYRPAQEEKTIELAFGNRTPGCRLTLQSADPRVGLSRIHVEILERAGAATAMTDFVIEGEALDLRTYKSLVEGFPDRDAQVSPAEIAQEIVTGMIRDRFE
jgi:hypothetical protein